MGVKIRKKIRNWSLGILFLFIAAIALVYITGQIAILKLASYHPAPGYMVTSHDRQIHVHCEGSGQVAVFLIAGINEFSLQWSQVKPLLARETKTCAYDRAGLGWSELGRHDPTIENAVKDMREVVHSVGESTPIVLVGHSYGALIARLYAQRYPSNVKAIVLLDPASEDMPERIAGYADVLDVVSAQFRSLSRLASFGLIALSLENIPSGLLQGEAIAQYRTVLATGSFFKAASAETSEMINNLRVMKNIGQGVPLEIPVVIISRGLADPIPGLPESSSRSLEKIWLELQTDLVVKMNAKHIIAEKSGHSIQLTEPELVFDAIRPFIRNK